jgi:hypothetical protein
MREQAKSGFGMVFDVVAATLQIVGMRGRASLRKHDGPEEGGVAG